MKTVKKVTIALLSALLLHFAFGFYSMSWSERLLRPVAKGMSQADVRSLVGAPVEEIHRDNRTTAWNYNKWFWTDAVVYFDTGGLVSAIEID
jgi:hypothetical protein